MNECTGKSGEQYQQAREQYQLHDFLDLVVAVLTELFVSLQYVQVQGVTLYVLNFVLIVNQVLVNSNMYLIYRVINMRINISVCPTF